ncbi:MAG: aminotransferase class V-fold PLP-dependent enzyme [Planctomycetota bacterium]|nr:aminotransferase class V-fold PLP-dependent enzyme [Planctomycetota bacterium]
MNSPAQRSTPEEVQAFRGLWVLDPGIHFLNHGSFGACPAEILDEQRAWRDRMEREPVLFLARQLQAHLDGVRERLADFLDCDVGGLVLVPNATTGVNAVLRSLELGEDDEVLITNLGYNACNNAARFVCERSGARLVTVEVPFPCTGPDEVLERVLAAVTERTTVAVLDHITSATGLVLPIARLVDALQDRGVDVLVDGAHAPGQVSLDLGALGAAYYTGNCHKWLCTPKGSAFLHVRADRRDRVYPTVISHGANTERPGATRLQDQFDWPGTVDFSPWLCIPAALDLFSREVPGGWEGVRARNHGFVLEARARLTAALGIAAPAPEDMLANLVALPLPGDGPEGHGAFDLDPLHVALFEQHAIEVPVFPGPVPGQRLLRVSGQLYNGDDDLNALVTALQAEGVLA